MSKPPISVVMSCYNGQRWLADAIESILNQSYKDFEFIIIDDGSTDNSVDIMNDYSSKDQRIRIVKKNNTGLPDSLNVGIEKARGKWIARIDADDLCQPDRLEKQYALAKSDPSLVLIGSAYCEIDQFGILGKFQTYPESHRRLKNNLLQNKRFFAHSSAFYKAEHVRRVGFYRPRIKKAEDYDLWLRLSEVGKLACIQEPLIFSRKHPDQISLEDAGRRQIIDARVALTSYWIRKFNQTDPVEMDEKQFHTFRKWIEKKIDENRLCEYRDFITQIKSLTFKKKYGSVLKKCFNEPGFVLRHFNFVVNGEGISHKLAKDWTNNIA